MTIPQFIFDRGELEAKFDHLAELSVGVIGDFCLDSYLFVDPARAETSIETGLRTSPVVDARHSPGGAGNVAANLASLGFGSVLAFGVTGADAHGAELRRLLGAAGVETSHLVTQDSSWATQTYMKVIENRRERDRFDFGVANQLTSVSLHRVIDAIRSELQKLDLIVINQQLTTGIHTEEFRTALAALIQNGDAPPTIVDSRNYSDVFGRATRKLNAHEAARYCGYTVPPETTISLRAAAEYTQELARAWDCDVVTTVGADGCLVSSEPPLHLPGVHHIVELDTVGAGDAMLAGLCAGAAVGMTLSEAALLGNLDAAVSVQALFQTGVTSREQLVSLAADPDYRYNPSFAQPGVDRMYHGGIEVLELPASIDPARNPGGESASAGAIRYAVFDHDGTISTVRQGWEPVMLETMMSAILGRLDGSSEDIAPEDYAEIEQACREFIEATTGVQTLVQMDGLRNLVERFGRASRVLSAAEYKAIYNDRLMEFVNNRLEQFQSGKLSTAELTMLGAVDFLHELADRGVRLYLASGTDVDDVRREAAALGYAELFGDRIYGATGTVASEPKREALRSILADIEERGSGSVVAFGDGPVEIRETRKRGGICVGIASDEVRRYGFNEDKRPRLVLAGAHMLIGDFSCRDELSTLLFPQNV